MKTKRILQALCLVISVAGAPRLAAQTVTISGGGNYISGSGFYLGTHSGSPAFGLSIIYDDGAGDAVTFRSARVASWLWENPDGGTGTSPSMRLDQANHLILYNGATDEEGVRLNPVGKKLTLGGSSGATLTAAGTALSTNGSFTVNGNFSSTSGSFSVTGAADQNIAFTSSGTGDIVFSTGGAERARINFSGNVGIGTSSPGSATKLQVAGRGLFTGGTIDPGDSSPSGVAIGYNTSSNYGFIDAIQTGVTSRPLVLNASGAFVGVGTITPQYKLHVRGNAGDDVPLVVDSLTSIAYLALRNNAGDNSIATLASTLYIGGGAVAGDIHFRNGWPTNMILTAAGNLGIGTTAPGARLHVVGSLAMGPAPALIHRGHGDLDTAGGAYMSWQDDSTGTFLERGWVGFGEGNASIGLQNNAGPIKLITPGGPVLIATTTGNVGVGATTPVTKLEVKSAASGFPATSGTNQGYASARFGNLQTNGVLDIGVNSGSGAWLQYSDQTNLSQVFPLLLNPNGGNIGIGTTNPQRNLAIVGSSVAVLQLADSYNGSQASDGFQIQQIGTNAHLVNAENGFLSVWTNAAERLRIDSGGNVGIGTINPTHKLAVNGTIRATEIIVDTGWADYVFADDYRLAPLSEVEAHIRAKKHLPGVPSAAEVAASGVSMGEMQATLLAKVEELTLHLIAQEKQMQAQHQEIAALKAEVSALRSHPNR
jgi:hypothetical protein